jgi:hypothetical protein
MSASKKPRPSQPRQVNARQTGLSDGHPLFPGKSSQNNPPIQSNLALKRSLGEIFDEFTVVISGELKSMNLKQFEAEHKKDPL